MERYADILCSRNSHYEKCSYGIIGDTAYHMCLPEELEFLEDHNNYESLPAINTEGIDVKVVRLW